MFDDHFMFEISNGPNQEEFLKGMISWCVKFELRNSQNNETHTSHVMVQSLQVMDYQAGHNWLFSGQLSRDQKLISVTGYYNSRTMTGYLKSA